MPAIAPQLSVESADRAPHDDRHNGQVIPIELQSLTGSDKRALTGAGAIELRSGRRTGGHGRLCAAAGAAPATIAFRSEELVEGQSLFGKVAYTVRRRGRGPALVTATDGYRTRPVRVPLDRRRGQLYLNLGHRLNATLPPGSELCVRSSSVGWITP